jgi:hypothetical protein
MTQLGQEKKYKVSRESSLDRPFLDQRACWFRSSSRPTSQKPVCQPNCKLQNQGFWRPSCCPIVFLRTVVYEFLKKLATQSNLEILIWGREGITLKYIIKSAKCCFSQYVSRRKMWSYLMNWRVFFEKKNVPFKPRSVSRGWCAQILTWI